MSLSLWCILFTSFLHLTVSKRVCIVGSGIAGSSSAFFIRNLSSHDITVFEANNVAGGRAEIISLCGESFEAGASIIHEKNLHLSHFVELLGLKRVNKPDQWFGIWSGSEFLYRDVYFGDGVFLKAVAGYLNTLRILMRYGLSSIQAMQEFVQELLEKWQHFYDNNRVPYSRVEPLLGSLGLHGYTQQALNQILRSRGVNSITIKELVTVVLRINYNQDSSISGLAGAVGLAGTGGQLWAVHGGNYQIAEGLLRLSGATFLPGHRVTSISYKPEGFYSLTAETLTNPRSSEVDGGEIVQHSCDAVIIAAPLELSAIELSPPVEVPHREYQHTFTTFVRGNLDAEYFGITDGKVPPLIGTIEEASIPFSCISLLKEYGPSDAAYKLFSRDVLSEKLLDQLFLWRNETVQIDWAAYPHFEVPEAFAPFLLDEYNLFYVNTFESAASAMETAAVAAHNVATLLVDRLESQATDIFAVFHKQEPEVRLGGGEL